MVFHSTMGECFGCAQKLAEAEKKLQIWFLNLKKEFPLVHVSWSHRDRDSQEAAFKSGESKLEWPNSKHNKIPSMALDIFEISDHFPSGRWDPMTFAKIADWSNANDYPILWGGTFQALKDFDHFELTS